jgi:hypothetical protein
MSDLLTEVAFALTQEHYRRSWLQIEASPEDHSKAMAEVALATIADKLEAPDSDLCDCAWLEDRSASTPPISPRTGIKMAHHCECTAVTASRAVRRGAATLHEQECSCGE